MLLLCFSLAACESALPTATAVLSPAATPARSFMPTATRRPIPPTPTPDYLPTLVPAPIAAADRSNAVAFIAVDKLSGGPDTLWLANVDGSGQKQLLDDVTRLGYGISNRLAWSPDGRWLAVTRQGGLWLVSRDGAFTQELVAYDPQKGNVYLFAWSPDGKRIAFTQQFGYYIDDYLGLSIVEVGTGRVETIARESPNAGWAYLLNWSPDGQHIAFAWSTQRLIILLAEHHASTPIPLCVGDVRQLLWSPDGMWLARWEYGNGRYARGYLCLNKLEGQTFNAIPPQPDVLVYTSNPVWTPDGRSLYMLASYRTLLDETAIVFDRLLRYDVVEQHLVQVASPQVRVADEGLTISQDGKWLSVVETQRDRAREQATRATIILIAVDGTDVIRWPVSAPAVSPLRWSGDNRHLIFSAGEYHQVEHSYVPIRQTLYALDVVTGGVTMLADRYQISAWAVSPVAN